MESNKIRLTNLAPNNNKIKCSMLEINGIKILLNSGSNSNLENHIKNIEDINPDIMLISHPSIEYIGGLPLFSNKKFPIYCSTPTSVLGRLSIEDIEKNFNFFYKINIYSEKQMEIFDRLNIVKYMQPISFKNLVFTAHNSGNTIGGTIWDIKIGCENLIIALDINHKRENHIDGADIKLFNKNNIILTNCNYMNSPCLERKKRDEIILDAVKENLKSKGKVIILTPYCRLLELGLILNGSKFLEKMKISVVSHLAKKFSEQTAMLIEFSGENAIENLCKTKDNPFLFDNIIFNNVIEDDSDIFIVPQKSSGFLRILLDKYGGSKNNSFLNFQDFEKENLLYFDKNYLNEENTKKIKTGNKGKEMKIFIPKIKLIKEEIIEIEKSEKESEEEKSDEEEKVHERKRQKINLVTEYGRNFIFEGEENKITPDNKKDDSKETFIIKRIEEVELIKKPLKMNIKIVKIPLLGISDAVSLKKIFFESEVKNLILFFDESKKKNNFFYKLLNSDSKEEIKKYENELNLETDSKYRTAVLSSNFFENINFKEINETKIANVRVKLENGEISAVEGKTEKCVGTLKLLDLKNDLQNKNFQVEVKENMLKVQDKLTIEVKGGEVKIEGEMDEYFMEIKKCVNNKLIFLD